MHYSCLVLSGYSRALAFNVCLWLDDDPGFSESRTVTSTSSTISRDEFFFVPENCNTAITYNCVNTQYYYIIVRKILVSIEQEY